MAIENGTQNAELGYILDPAFQIEGLNGKPVVGGWICIYEAGTGNKYISYENFDGAQNPFKIPLKSDGRAVILGDPSRTYDVYAYDSYGNQLFSRLNVQCNVPGNISINGADTRIKNTDGTLDVSLRTLGNNVREYTVNTNNKVLDLREPLYFVENSNTATIIGVSGSGGSGGGGAGDPEVNYLVHANSATWNDVSAKLNTTAFSTVSGNFLTDIPDSYSTKDYVQSSVSSKLDSTAFSTISGNFLTAHQDLSDYLTKTSADTLYQPIGNYVDATALDGKVDTSSFTALNEKVEYISGTLSGTYELSAGSGIDITDYPNEQKTVISVTAQGGNPEVEAEVIAHSAYWNTVSNKLNTTAFSTVSGNFLTAVPDIYLQNTDLTVVDNKITEISGVQLSAGTELEFEYDAANNISAINNSAISTTPSQALYAQSPLYTGVSGTSSFIGFDASAISADIARMLGVDETVLWSGDELTATVSESLTNFETIKIYAHWTYNGTFTTRTMSEIPGSAINFNLFAITPAKTTTQDTSANVYTLASLYKVNDLNITPINKSRIQYAAAETSTMASNTYSNIDVLKLTKIVGIGRKV